jgi:subtilisin family serine protease
MNTHQQLPSWPRSSKIVINADAEVAANDEKETSDDHSFAGDKVSPELREMMQAKGARSVEAILQVSDSHQAGLNQLLAENNIKVSQRLGSSIVVNMPMKAIEKLAASNLVAHMSRDRKVGSLGHVSQATGTDVARQQAYSTVNSLDGSGIGIAIVDSGIDAAHQEFQNAYGTASRVIYSQNF